VKKLFSIVLAALLIFSILPQQQASASTFSDVPARHGFYKEIMYLLNEGVISPAKKYGVNDKVSRAEVAVMISKAVQLNGEKTKTPFKDVPQSHAASGYINSAVNAGIIKGFTDGTFRPNGLVNRGELAIFLANAFVLQEESSTKFIDVSPSMASYSSIQKMVQARITNGFSDNTFRPTEKLTRGEISAFIARAMQVKQNVDDVEKEMKVHFIEIISKDLERETVGIKNTGSAEIDLTGWKLLSVQGHQTYTFPEFTLKAGETVYITSGLYAKDNGTTHLRWTTENMWNNTGDAAKLFDSKGNLVHEMD
jgi:hypothetical protein